MSLTRLLKFPTVADTVCSFFFLPFLSPAQAPTEQKRWLKATPSVPPPLSPPSVRLLSTYPSEAEAPTTALRTYVHTPPPLLFCWVISSHFPSQKKQDGLKAAKKSRRKEEGGNMGSQGERGGSLD